MIPSASSAENNGMLLRGEKETQKRKKNITAPMRGAKKGLKWIE